MGFNDEFGQKILDNLKSQVEPKQYETWIAGLNFIEVPPDIITISLPNTFYIEWYKKNYLSLMETSIAETTGKKYAVQFVALPEQSRLFTDDLFPAPASSLKGRREAKQSVRADTSPGGKGAVIKDARERTNSSNKYDFALNPNYVFDRFVVGMCNRLAHAAAMAVAENPGKAYNPLFIHGGVGLGKTHLLQAACHQIITKHPHLSIYYRSGEGFVNDYIAAVKNNAFESFRQQCRSKDILIIDDIHFLGSGGKTASQEEFFHTFNALHNVNKQIVLSSDSPPKEIPTLHERLVSRFNWGMVARFEPPDYETRMAILRKKIDAYKINIEDDIIKVIAESVSTNIRDLEGTLIRLIGLARSSNQNPSLALAHEALKDIIGSVSPNINIITIIDMVANYFNFSSTELQSKSRSKSVSLARQIGCYLARQLKPDLSLEEIGSALGGREHSTVLHSIEKIRKRSQKDAQFKETLKMLTADIKKKSG
ncbi:MAG: chromosomal replication initiator protein DnaA [Planctomycetota bacterium]|nr:chromosomal replication initiator protein DnaA [Planctomycetota bacterium]MDI6786929.1 chromosomal replication initiator protein DnaA [Planctomycetota bacterium]